jgi:bifunctional DNA-binding transcriptional regulator/antitoxin component of YhaV-PrlF toxin-antitoxin module
MADTFEDKYHFGLNIDLRALPFLEDMLKRAETTIPQPLREAFGDKSPSKKLCVAIDEDQIAFADAKSCRFIASAGTASCRSIFLRNPKTSATVVVHLTAASEENSLLQAIKKIAQRADELDMYIMGGEGRCDSVTDEVWQKHVREINSKKYKEHTADEIEETIDNIFAVADELSIKIKPKVINLFNAKRTANAVVDTVTGEFFYVLDDVIEPFILHSRHEEGNDHPYGKPILKVFDGLENRPELPPQ